MNLIIDLLDIKYRIKSMKNNHSMLFYENKYYNKGFKIIAGVDEVGRGCWAGPVVAASVIFPKNYVNEKIKDSKVLAKKIREKLFLEIKTHALAIGIGYCSARKIDKTNIKLASIEAMQQAIKNLKIKPNCILVDAEKISVSKIHIVPIVKGDAKSMSIAAASIIAKVTRDNFLNEIDEVYPMYGFAKHKGYGTQFHIQTLKKYGPLNNIHRMSFTPIKNILKSLYK